VSPLRHVDYFFPILYFAFLSPVRAASRLLLSTPSPVPCPVMSWFAPATSFCMEDHCVWDTLDVFFFFRCHLLFMSNGFLLLYSLTPPLSHLHFLSRLFSSLWCCAIVPSLLRLSGSALPFGPVAFFCPTLRLLQVHRACPAEFSLPFTLFPNILSNSPTSPLPRVPPLPEMCALARSSHTPTRTPLFPLLSLSVSYCRSFD